MNRPPIRSAMETPPLTRGRLFALSCEVGLVGNTPAYAGKTPSQAAKVRRDRKHPRLRGEDWYALDTCDPTTETPPLTRGRRASCPSRRPGSGNTPAYAGKTIWPLVAPKRLRETPPLTRGRPLARSRSRSSSRKHPRLRGEDVKPRRVATSDSETPPLTRGRPDTRRQGASS